MGADADIIRDRKIHGFFHRNWITRMAAAGYIGGRDYPHKLGVIAIALANVTIKVDLHDYFFGSLFEIYTPREENSSFVRTASPGPQLL